MLWHLLEARRPLPEDIDPWGFSNLPGGVLDDLGWLADDAGGWWRWDERAGGARFAERIAWQVAYREWAGAHGL
jgi:hypothetical protein